MGDMLDTHMPPPMVPMLPQSPPTLELTSSARDLLTPMLKPSHGWPTPTTDMLDTHTPPPMELTSSARDPLIPNQNPGMELTDTLPHTPPMVDTLPTVHTPTDVVSMAGTDTDGKNFTK